MIKKKNILVSAPSMYQGVTFLPSIFGILKSSCQKWSDQLDWLEPLFTYSSSCEEAIKKYDVNIGVLALSCYEWNWDYQLEIAALCKQLNPRCLVIAGGPQPDWKDKQFFENHLNIDVVVKGEPEDAFPNLIENWLLTNEIPKDIPGVWTKNQPSEVANLNVVRSQKLPIESPWTAHKPIYKKLLSEMDRARNPNLWVTWETTRGCPYQCVFCDWGSSTFAKIREVEMERLKEELLFFAELKIETIYITDANFGILERDIEITQMAADVKAKFGFPKTIFFNPAKNNPGRLVEIYKILHQNKLLNYCIQNNLQSTQADVLKVMKRIDVGAEKQRTFINEIYDTGINMGAALIAGNPGESLTAFKSSLFDVLEWGIHSEIRIFPWALLPNAPAAEPDFMKKNAIKVVERPTMRNAVGRDVAQSKFSGKSKYLVSHSKLTESEWVEEQLYSTFLLTAHCMGLTRFIAIYLRKTHNVIYSSFYEDLYSEFFIKDYSKLSSQLRTHFENYLIHDNAIINLDFDPPLDIQIDPEAWLYLSFAVKKDEFYSSLHAYLQKKYPGNDVNDVCRLNSILVIDPSYDPHSGRSAIFDYDWKTYFEVAENPAIESLPKPRVVLSYLQLNQSGTGPYLDIPLDYTKGLLNMRLSTFNHRVIGQKSSRHVRTYLQLRHAQQTIERFAEANITLSV